MYKGTSRYHAKKIDKALSLDRLALQAKKNETDKQLNEHRNNLVALCCDQPADISGNWTSNIDVSYSISQTQSGFTCLPLNYIQREKVPLPETVFLQHGPATGVRAQQLEQ